MVLAPFVYCVIPVRACVCVCLSLVVVVVVVDRSVRVHFVVVVVVVVVLEREKEREKEIPRILCVVMSSCQCLLYFVYRPNLIFSVCGKYNFLSFFFKVLIK